MALCSIHLVFLRSRVLSVFVYIIFDILVFFDFFGIPNIRLKGTVKVLEERVFGILFAEEDLLYWDMPVDA